jgi:hypothetical protein
MESHLPQNMHHLMIEISSEYPQTYYTIFLRIPKFLGSNLLQNIHHL